jgi:hypothetical protein
MALNAVERRLALLCEDWLAFRADPSLRLLVWQVPDDALRLVQCFVQAQKHDLAYSSRDLFIALDAPFEHSLQYARDLKEQLWGQYQASAKDWSAQGLAPNWNFDPQAVPDTATAVMAALKSLGSGHHTAIGHLAAVLMPGEVAHADYWGEWLLRALQSGLPERLRLVVIDSLDHPRLERLTPQRDARIRVQRPAVHGLAMAQETFAQEPTVGPAGTFRQMLMGVMSLIEHGSLAQVQAQAATALAFARQQNWSDQQVVLRMLTAGALLKDAQHAAAAQEYQTAREAAVQAQETDHPAGAKLVVQTWFGEAGARLAAGDDAAAAACYDAAAVAAAPDPNPLMTLEALRMSAFCHARSNDLATAMDRGRQALAQGARLQPQARSWSTLPLAALELLRVQAPSVVQQITEVQHRMQQQLGEVTQSMETDAATVEASSHPSATSELQARFEREETNCHYQAEQALQAVVREALAAWQAEFEHIRELLGADWPLHSAWSAALPPAAGGTT